MAKSKKTPRKGAKRPYRVSEKVRDFESRSMVGRGKIKSLLEGLKATP